MTALLDERWRSQALARQLEATWHAHRADVSPPIDVRALAAVDSTNTRLLEAARDDAVAHLRVLVGEAQTAGRGRHGRAWHSSPGASLAFSLALGGGPEALRLGSGQASLIVGAAVADALEPPCASPTASLPELPRIALKWPNDLWLRDPASPFGGRKLAGILLETATTPGGRVLVVGIGINLRAVAPADAPVYGVASLDEVAPDDDIDGPAVLLRVAPAVLAALLRPAGDATWREAWTRRDLLAGRQVETRCAEQRLAGIARGIDNDGALRLQRDDDGQIIVISSGEVSVRPLPET